MNVRYAVTILSSLVAILVIFASGSGLFSKMSGTSYTYETPRGQNVKLFGRGLYRYDTVFFASGFKGQDATALFIGIPLLILSIYFYQRGITTGHFLLLGMLGYFLYLYASMALGAAYNRLFLIYIIIFSSSLFAFVYLFTSTQTLVIASSLAEEMPRRPLAIFMLAAGFITLFVWGGPLAGALISGGVPDKMDSYTAMVTYALDLAIITPATFLCSAYILKGNPLGYVIAFPLLTLIILLAPQIILSTFFQKSAGVNLSPAEMVGPVAGFVILGIAALWLLRTLLRYLI